MKHARKLKSFETGKSVRLKNVELSVFVNNFANPKKRLDIYLLPEIRFTRQGDIFYYLTLSWLTVSVYFFLIHIKKQYRSIFNKVNG
ncbi:MAG: hypothetical protein LBK58_11625 [Prevotellaceae bacterium]|jgi:hypothetical protein|nr:hypothetical protein [Prevotellaceae bacterium]